MKLLLSVTLEKSHIGELIVFNRKLFSLEETANGWVDTQLRMCGSDVCFNGLTSSYEYNILSFGEDDDGMCKSKPQKCDFYPHEPNVKLHTVYMYSVWSSS